MVNGNYLCTITNLIFSECVTLFEIHNVYMSTYLKKTNSS